MILFENVYNKAINLFEDPKIKKAYLTNKIQFCKLMYPFLNSSYSLFNNPSFVGVELSNVKDPSGQMEIFDADGNNKKFTLSFTPIENSIFEYKQNGKVVEGIFNKDENSIEFPDVLEEGEYSCEVYFPGCFLSDFNFAYRDDLIQGNVTKIEDVLARMLVRAWGERTRNFLLDIQNILTTTDFKLHPASNALKSKVEWMSQLEQEISRLQNKLAFNVRFARNSNWGKRSW